MNELYTNVWFFYFFGPKHVRYLFQVSRDGRNAFGVQGRHAMEHNCVLHQQSQVLRASTLWLNQTQIAYSPANRIVYQESSGSCFYPHVMLQEIELNQTSPSSVCSAMESCRSRCHGLGCSGMLRICKGGVLCYCKYWLATSFPVLSANFVCIDIEPRCFFWSRRCLLDFWSFSYSDHSPWVGR